MLENKKIAAGKDLKNSVIEAMKKFPMLERNINGPNRTSTKVCYWPAIDKREILVSPA